MMHHGSCHCGKMKFEFEGTIDGAVACNCSICSRKGTLLWAAPEADFKLLTALAEMSAYTFNTPAACNPMRNTRKENPSTSIFVA
jgi:hypothetical protein